MSKNFNISCSVCFSKDLYKYGKDKTEKQKYQCKTLHRQFTKNPALNQNLIIQNTLFVAQELIHTMIMNIISDSSIAPTDWNIFINTSYDYIDSSIDKKYLKLS